VRLGTISVGKGNQRANDDGGKNLRLDSDGVTPKADIVTNGRALEHYEPPKSEIRDSEILSL